MVRGRVFYNREKSNRRSRYVFGLVVTVIVCWFGGLFWFISALPQMPQDFNHKADAIVVLTGGEGRVKAGFDLLENKNAKQMFISGVYRGVEVKELIALSRKAPRELECCVTLGYEAGDTIGNAYETAEWMHDREYQSMILVTSNYHISRARMEMEMRLPDETITTFPVAPTSVDLPHWWQSQELTALLIAEYNKYLLTSCRYLGFRIIHFIV